MRTFGFAKIHDTLLIAVFVLNFLCRSPLQEGENRGTGGTPPTLGTTTRSK